MLAPLPYHRALAEHLRHTEPELWRWFRSAEAGEQHEQEVRRDLLRSTYRLEAGAHPEVHAAAARARRLLGVEAEIVVYQAQGEAAPNAVLLSLGTQAHVVFTGGLMSLLGAVELEAVVAHELGHFALGLLDGGAYLTAERMLTAFANDPRAARAPRERAPLRARHGDRRRPGEPARRRRARRRRREPRQDDDRARKRRCGQPRAGPGRQARGPGGARGRRRARPARRRRRPAAAAPGRADRAPAAAVQPRARRRRPLDRHLRRLRGRRRRPLARGRRRAGRGGRPRLPAGLHHLGARARSSRRAERRALARPPAREPRVRDRSLGAGGRRAARALPRQPLPAQPAPAPGRRARRSSASSSASCAGAT